MVDGNRHRGMSVTDLTSHNNQVDISRTVRVFWGGLAINYCMGTNRNDT